MRIALVNNKGGVGKTTTVVTLARIWRDRQPLIIDTDAQQATRLFNDVETVVARPGDAARVLHQHRARLVLIDCPGHLELCAPVLAEADAILMPVEADILSLNASVRAFGELARNCPRTPARAFLSRYSAGDGAARKARDAARAEWGSTLCNTVIYFRRAFADAAENGQTIMDFAPGSLPARQYEKLAEEIRTWLDF